MGKIRNSFSDVIESLKQEEGDKVKELSIEQSFSINEKVAEAMNEFKKESRIKEMNSLHAASLMFLNG